MQRQTAGVASIEIINHTDSEKNKRSVQNFKRLQNYKINTTNVATGIINAIIKKY